MIDALASESHFADHIRPIWEAIPPEVRGTFYDRKMAPIAIGRPTLVAASSDMKRAKITGRRIAMMEHGCGQSFGGDPRTDRTASYAGNSGRDPVSLFLHPGEHPASRDRAKYPNARVEVVGCAKLDALPRPPRKDPPVVAVAFHWNCGLCAETMPAWHGFQGQLKALAREYEVIGHGHPRIIERLARYYRRLGIETVRSFPEVCERADVYVNDASSTLFEFASTGRPVVVMNSRLYRRKVNHGLRFWEASTVGVNVEQTDSLIEAVGEALEDSKSRQDAREAALDLVYAYRTGAAQRAVVALVDWASESREAVA